MTLRKKMIFAFLAVTLVPFGAMLIGLRGAAVSEAEQLVGSRLQDNVEQAGNSVDQFMINCIRDMKAFAADPKYVGVPPEAARKHLAQLTYFYPYFDSFMFADTTGVVRTSSSSRQVGRSLFDIYDNMRDEFEQAISGPAGPVYVSDLADLSAPQREIADRGDLKNLNLRLQMLSPVFNAEGVCIGVIVGSLVTQQLRDLLEDIDLRVPGNEYSALLDSEGRILMTTSPDLPLLSEFPGIEGSGQNGAHGSGFRSYMGADGEKMMSGYSTLWTYGANDSGGWRLVSTAPYAVIMQPVHDSMRTGRIVLVAALILAGLTGMLLSHRLAQPILQLSAGVKSFAAGDMDSRVAIRSRDETGELATAFNQMAGTIQQQVAELRGANDELEARVAERTSELAQINQSLTQEVAERKAAQQQLEKTRNELAGINADLEAEVTERSRVAEALRRQQEELRILFDLIPAFVWFKDTHNRHLRVNQRAATAVGRTVEEMEGEHAKHAYPDAADRFYEDDLLVISSKQPKLGILEKIQLANGEECWLQTDKVPYCDDDGNVVGIVVMAQDITERRRSEDKLKKTQEELVEVSRQAGMAEVATSVLHNVGNVLNSVNVTTTVLSDRLRNSKSVNIGKVADLLQEHQGDLGTFLTTDPKGKQLPAYITILAKHLTQEHLTIQEELKSLHMNVEHIKDIVAMQQTYAKVFGVSELVTPKQMVEDALHLNAGALVRHEVGVMREYEDVPAILVEKHKVLQILVNLIRNAKYACDEGGGTNKVITLRVARQDDVALISVLDNGIGIPPENLDRIFRHGFTTRAAGHGFGLHNSALVARELGGSLSVHSDGEGKGAEFTLSLPFNTGEDQV